jgi:hypothetical protein
MYKYVFSVNHFAYINGWKHSDETELYLANDRLCGLTSEFLAVDPEARVRFPALPDFLRSRGVWNGVHSAS